MGISLDQIHHRFSFFKIYGPDIKSHNLVILSFYLDILKGYRELEMYTLCNQSISLSNGIFLRSYGYFFKANIFRFLFF